jgi:hypothetical protein
MNTALNPIDGKPTLLAKIRQNLQVICIVLYILYHVIPVSCVYILHFRLSDFLGMSHNRSVSILKIMEPLMSLLRFEIHGAVEAIWGTCSGPTQPRSSKSQGVAT